MSITQLNSSHFVVFIQLTDLLARRFFRFFGFIESFQRVSTLLSKEGMGSVAGWLDLAKWTCFGLYFILEDLTIVCDTRHFPVAVN